MLPLVVYTCALALALVLLYFFYANWIWHVLSAVAALVIGLLPPNLIPIPAEWGLTRDLVLGFVFVFLMVWGLGAPLFNKHHAQHVHHHA